MYFDDNTIARLASRADLGDARAEVELRAQLEPRLVFIVRHALRGGRAPASLAQRILARARRLAADKSLATETPEKLIERVAHFLCDAILAGFRRQRSRLNETMCDF